MEFCHLGLIHGVALVVERLLPTGNLHPVLRWFVTFHVICFAWVFSELSLLSNALDVLTAVVTFSRRRPGFQSSSAIANSSEP